ncbi:hypothetical protein IWW36_001782 [Coemansia brasiliensis]|uniref:Uncharacterized protein n=1 Tax=Coemansia brasiliensis TaxID=2650707 RepID=A0A9W8I8H8_9FUNG|nr:hypothetical protein IWW36_001782 [Coemansia brasiliensis]
MAQQLGSDGGSTVAGGPSAVSNANVNNGEQSTNSLLSTGESGGNEFSGVTNSKFSSSLSNVGLSDNNIVNPSSSSTSGNSGPTTNGEHNHIGNDVIPHHRFLRRSAVYNNYGGYDYPHPAAGYAPAPYAPVHYAQPVYPYPVYAQPVYAHPAPYAAGANRNYQSASIVQNHA